MTLLSFEQRIKLARHALTQDPETKAKILSILKKSNQNLQLQSKSFLNNEKIPKKHTRLGDNLSPEIFWSKPPPGTQSLVLICEDPDATNPEKLWVHWILFNIDSKISSLKEGTSEGTPGTNDFGNTKWDGPEPPKGTGPHRYVFKLWALNKKSGLPPGSTKSQVLEAIKGHILSQGELTGIFKR